MSRLRLRLLALFTLATTAALGFSSKQAVVAYEFAQGDHANMSPEMLTAATLKTDISPDAGRIEAGQYNNEFFGFRITFPDTWAIASQTTTDGLLDTGTELLAGDDPTLSASIQAAEQRTYQLLLISELPIGTPTPEFNPNLVVMAENVSHLPGITSGADYLQSVGYLLQQASLPYTLDSGPYEFQIGGRTFHRIDLSLSSFGFEIKQSYVATLDRGYILGFILSGTEETMGSLNEIAESVEF